MNRFARTSMYAIPAAALLGISNAQAAVDSSVGTALTGLQTDGLAIAALVTPVVVALLAAGVGIKLIKRFGNKV